MGHKFVDLLNILVLRFPYFKAMRSNLVMGIESFDFGYTKLFICKLVCITATLFAWACSADGTFQFKKQDLRLCGEFLHL